MGAYAVLFAEKKEKMPPRRRGGNIGRRTAAALSMAAQRANENEDQREERLAEQRERNNAAAVRSPTVTPTRRRTAAQRIRRNMTDRARNMTNRVCGAGLYKAAFGYEAEFDYRQHRFVQIGAMDQVCAFCKAKKFPNESAGMCCASGKVKLPALQQPPEPLNTLFSSGSAESQHFLRYIRAYNNCFQMTSFGATQIVRHGYMPTFKVNKAAYPYDTHTDITTHSTTTEDIEFTGTRASLPSCGISVANCGCPSRIFANIFHWRRRSRG